MTLASSLPTSVSTNMHKFITLTASDALDFSKTTLKNPSGAFSAMCAGAGAWIVWDKSNEGNNSVTKLIGIILLTAGAYNTTHEYYQSKTHELTQTIEHLKTLEQTKETQERIQRIEAILSSFNSKSKKSKR